MNHMRLHQRLEAVLARHDIHTLTTGGFAMLALRDVASAFDLVGAARTTDSFPPLRGLSLGAPLEARYRNLPARGARCARRHGWVGSLGDEASWTRLGLMELWRCRVRASRPRRDCRAPENTTGQYRISLGVERDGVWIWGDVEI
jgi:hypothetical protein